MLKNMFIYLFTLVLPLLVIVAVFRGLFGFNAFDWSAFLHIIEQEFSSTYNSFEAVVDVFSGIFKVFSENMLSTPHVSVPDPSGNWIADILNMFLGVFNTLFAIATLLIQLMMNAVPILNALINFVIVMVGDLLTVFRLLFLFITESSPYTRDPYYTGQIVQAIVA